MKQYLCFALLSLFLNGCVGTSSLGPHDNRDFYQESQLSELAGVYKNDGNGGEQNPNSHHYLSELIWGSDYPIMSPKGYPAHDAVELIAVTAANNSLTAKAIQNGCVVYEKTYINGHDFQLKDGQLIIRKRFFPLGVSILAGPAYQETILGIDTGKQGKARTTLYGAGLVYMFIPTAGSMTSDVRFERVPDKAQGYQPCGNR